MSLLLLLLLLVVVVVLVHVLRGHHLLVLLLLLRMLHLLLVHRMSSLLLGRVKTCRRHLLLGGPVVSCQCGRHEGRMEGFLLANQMMVGLLLLRVRQAHGHMLLLLLLMEHLLSLLLLGSCVDGLLGRHAGSQLLLLANVLRRRRQSSIEIRLAKAEARSGGGKFAGSGGDLPV